MKGKGSPRRSAQTLMMNFVNDFIDFGEMHGAMNPVIVSLMQ